MRQLAIVSACVLAALVAAGCGSGARTNCQVPPDRALLIAVRAHAGPVVLPSETQTGNASRLTITSCQTSSTEATATLTVFGLRDAKSRDVRHGLKLERKGGGDWTVTADAHTQRCPPRSGSQEFTSEKCRN